MIAFSGSRKTMIRLIPKIFYANVDDGVDLFAACLGFAVRDRTKVCVIFRQWPAPVA